MVVAVMLAATVIVIAGIAHVVAQCATGAATDCRTDHAAGVATNLLPDDVATGCAQRAANGVFSTAAAIRADHAAGSATETGTDRSASVATDLLTNHRTHCAT